VEGFQPLCIGVPQSVLQVQRLPLVFMNGNRLISCLLIEGGCYAGVVQVDAAAMLWQRGKPVEQLLLCQPLKLVRAICGQRNPGSCWAAAPAAACTCTCIL
jgi:hypothetical protein